MDLIERYLGAVRWNLPSAKADDIVAELADLIAARIEDREEMLGRPLDKSEVSQILREFGHPLAVAGQYHGQQVLIGAELFPFYWFALRIMLAVFAVIETVKIAGRIAVGSQPFFQAISHGLGDAANTLLTIGALITLAFAAIERTGWLDTYLARWKPEELPDLGKLRLELPLRKRWEPAFEIAFGIGFLIWWAGGFTIPFFPHDDGVKVAAAPVWATLYWPVVVLVWARILLSLIGFLRPAWKPLRAALILGSTAGTLAIAAALRAAGQIVIVAGPDADKVAKIQQSLDKSLEIAVVVVAAISAWQCVKELYQLYKERR
ncbi:MULTISPECIES: hypothetical protein [unclassified Sphingomonas]|jgi:hypothetical protein|nr:MULTISPECIES: hypothetical protein [unclassified Sphingomonas]